MNLNWKIKKTRDIIEFNPKELLKKNTSAKKVSMEKLKPFTKDIDEYEISEFKGGTKFKNGDTLMARITPCLENGKTCQINILNDNEIGFGSTEFIVLREKESISDKNYIYYLSLSPDFRGEAIKSMIGSSGRQRVQKDVLMNLQLNIPPLKEQIIIGKILSQIDELIFCNNKINKNLELQIKLIFNKWFFNFDLPNNLNGLNNKFKDSELGSIPERWDVDYLGSKKSITIIGSGINEFNDTKIYIATADVDNSNIINNKTLITLEDKPSRANMQPVEKSVWFAKMIDSRKLIMVDEFFDDILQNYIFSTGFCGLKCSDDAFYYIWSFLLTNEFDTIKNNYCTGTTMMTINNKDVKNIKFVLPDSDTLLEFNKIAEPVFKKIYLNAQEINILTNLRDILLPKLMSGEIDVSTIEI